MITEEYLETHYEMVQAITLRYIVGDMRGKVLEYHNSMGHAGLYQLAKELTDKFEAKYKDVIWGEERDWFDTIEEFLKEEGI